MFGYVPSVHKAEMLAREYDAWTSGVYGSALPGARQVLRPG